MPVANMNGASFHESRAPPPGHFVFNNDGPVNLNMHLHFDAVHLCTALVTRAQPPAPTQPQPAVATPSVAERRDSRSDRHLKRRRPSANGNSSTSKTPATHARGASILSSLTGAKSSEPALYALMQWDRADYDADDNDALRINSIHAELKLSDSDLERTALLSHEPRNCQHELVALPVAESVRAAINEMVDSLPNDSTLYSLAPDHVGILKPGLLGLCERNNIPLAALDVSHLERLLFEFLPAYVHQISKLPMVASRAAALALVWSSLTRNLMSCQARRVFADILGDKLGETLDDLAGRARFADGDVSLVKLIEAQRSRYRPWPRSTDSLCARQLAGALAFGNRLVHQHRPAVSARPDSHQAAHPPLPRAPLSLSPSARRRPPALARH